MSIYNPDTEEDLIKTYAITVTIKDRYQTQLVSPVTVVNYTTNNKNLEIPNIGFNEWPILQPEETYNLVFDILIS